jgi:hypothetical protein
MAGQDQRDVGLGQAEAAKEALTWNIYDLDFAVRKSRRYHEKLHAFYGLWRDWVKIVTVITGSGLFFVLFANAKFPAEFLAAFVAVWAALDYVMAPDRRAELHRKLCEQFIDLAAEIERMPVTEEAYRNLAAKRLEIEKAEPPCKRLVDLAARNDECRSRDFPPEDLVPLSRLQTALGYFATFGIRRLEEWKADRQRARGDAPVRA